MRFEIKNRGYVRSVMFMVCDGLGLERSAVIGKSRVPKLVRCRAMICKLLKDEGETFETIGSVVYRDYSSVIYLVSRHDKYMEGEDYKKLYLKLSSMKIKLSIIEKIKFHQDELEKLYKLL